MSRVEVIAGDCVAVMADLAAAGRLVDSIVSDPPYHLASIVRRFGGANAAPAQHGTDGAFARASRGFMGQQWDGGDVAFRVETWRRAYDVLKPGGHLLAFSATRTYHRMACAIEDAGFEIRDQIGWLYGTGFPKSLDIAAAIDKRRDWSALPRLQAEIRRARMALGISQSEAARRCGLIAPDESLGGGGYMWFETGLRMPTRAQWAGLKIALSLGDEFDSAFEAAEREVVGHHQGTTPGLVGKRFASAGGEITAPATDAARAWQGWGTALKPAWEPVVVARKPIDGTVAANVLKHGTGGLNIDASRIEASNGQLAEKYASVQKSGARTNRIFGADRQDRANDGPHSKGRYPANVIHDGSTEVVDAFPDGAARFFYSAKADAGDRQGSTHPTVKPVDLMAYLVRLVTPAGGTVLDPFAGTGSTGIAALREGFRAVLIEQSPEYVADIRRRLDHVSGGDAPLFAAASDQRTEPDQLDLVQTIEAAE